MKHNNNNNNNENKTNGIGFPFFARPNKKWKFAIPSRISSHSNPDSLFTYGFWTEWTLKREIHDGYNYMSY